MPLPQQLPSAQEMRDRRRKALEDAALKGITEVLEDVDPTDDPQIFWASVRRIPSLEAIRCLKVRDITDLASCARQIRIFLHGSGHSFNPTDHLGRIEALSKLGHLRTAALSAMVDILWREFPGTPTPPTDLHTPNVNLFFNMVQPKIGPFTCYRVTQTLGVATAMDDRAIQVVLFRYPRMAVVDHWLLFGLPDLEAFPRTFTEVLRDLRVFL